MRLWTISVRGEDIFEVEADTKEEAISQAVDLFNINHFHDSLDTYVVADRDFEDE